MDKVTIKDNGNNLDTYQETYTRDYWLKLYAGMVLQGLSSIPSIVKDTNRHPTYNELADEAKLRAEILVETMFKDES